MNYDGRFDKYIRFGVNGIIFYDTIVDYFVMADKGKKGKRGYISNPEPYDEYKPRKCKFYRTHFKPNKSMVLNLDAIYYHIDKLFKKVDDLSTDLTEGFSSHLSVSYEVIQLAVWMGFKKIILVGHDCDWSKGSFHDPDDYGSTKNNFDQWEKIQEWATNIGVEIVIHNPVKLTMFKEIA
jgi:hypothetical protein